MSLLSDMPLSAAQWYDKGVFFRQRASFGEAINAFDMAIRTARSESECLAQQGLTDDSLESIIKKSLASIELIQGINAFVNVDLMNP